jgi:acyl-[acyl-carrier-protein]-phospholipid O-acyltransferase/long-chain-fatty-acid--[acyl-carrier-protein] ligase
VKSNLIKRGFLSLTATQFFGAANDNIIKGVIIFMVVDGAWEGRLGPGGQGIVSICFTLPFILLSGYAGQFADRNSKRYVSVLVKIIEVPIALAALIGFWSGSLWVSLAALTALTCQSAFFGPAKYGMIPELVDSRDLSRANGAINMMTNIAVIVGTYAAGEIADAYNPPEGPGVLWLPGVVMLLIAAAGLLAVLFLPPLTPGDRNLKYFGNPFAVYLGVLKEMAGSPLILVMLAWGYFYFIAGLALLIIPEYTIVLSEYDVTRAEASMLLGVLAVSIGVGSGMAGLISGHAIHPRLIPIGAAGLTLFCILLGTVPPTLPYPDLAERWRIVPSSLSGFIFGAGVSAGFYIIPLQALLQRLSPADERGRFLGVANGVSFTFLTFSAGLYWLIRPAFGTGDAQHPEKIFLLSAGLMIVGAAFFLWRLRVRGFSFDRME